MVVYYSWVFNAFIVSKNDYWNNSDICVGGFIYYDGDCMRKEIVFGGETMFDYYIENNESGVRILSYKGTGIREMSIPKSGKSLYPKIMFRKNGKKINADVHRVIAENLIPFPRPKHISLRDWAATPNEVKAHIKSLYFVNHKDHDKYNCALSNLEWVTSKGNARAYRKHVETLR